MDSGCISGGILKLRELISEHEPYLAYDFRHRFQLSVYDIGVKVSYREAIMLVNVLLADQSSWTFAHVNEWKFPASMEWIKLADLLDVQIMSKSKNKPKPSPRPWPDTSVNRVGDNSKRSQTEILQVLDAMRPKENDGTDSTSNSVR